MENSKIKEKFPIYNYEKEKLYIEKCDNYMRTVHGIGLVKTQIDIIREFISEIRMNHGIYSVYKKAEKYNMGIEKLTSFAGNCLFESIIMTGIVGTEMTVEKLRKGLATIMILFKDYKNFFPNDESSLKDIFELLNTGDCEIEYVVQTSKKNGKKVKLYTYEAMCQDMSNLNSWTRLPTQLIIMLVSFLFKAKITIINDTSYEWDAITNVWENTDLPKELLKSIYLGHIQECHYVPLTNNRLSTYKTYSTQKIKYVMMMKEINK